MASHSLLTSQDSSISGIQHFCLFVGIGYFCVKGKLLALFSFYMHLVVRATSQGIVLILDSRESQSPLDFCAFHVYLRMLWISSG
ncbi:hypothetical protein ACFX14_031950 [Malus domestica]